MSLPPSFQRSPRFVPDLPEGELEIPRPPAPPTAPTASLLTLLLPMAATIMGMCIMFLIMRSRPGGFSVTYLFYSLPMMAVSYGLSIYTFSAQRRTFRKAMQARQDKFTAVLTDLRHQLQRTRDWHLQTLRGIHPDPLECLDRAERLDSRLWERSPRDRDFLHLRMGLGEVPALLTVKPPRQEMAVEPDPLLAAAQQLADEYRSVAGSPLCLPLAEVGNIGVVGDRTAIQEAVRALVVQLATGHAPDEVKLVAVFPEAEAAQWGWLRWLPHVWSDGGQTRYLASCREDAHELMTDLFDRLSRRRLLQESAMHAPVYVFLLADSLLVEGEAALPLILQDGQAIGAMAVVLAARRQDLPQECRGVMDLTGNAGQLVLSVPRLTQTTFVPDRVSLDLAERLARRMAPLRLRRMAAPDELPGSVPLTGLFDVNRIEGLEVQSRWRASEPQTSLAVPIGIRAGGEKLFLDLHEKGHGPHGLVAGATGSGKSELLQAIIVSLAVSFHPHEVAFVLVDYKGGGMANVFATLPHLMGTITNLQGRLALRALAALKGELRRRQAVLAKAGVTHIDDYQRLRRQGQPLAPMPHLILIVDEFAELKSEQPDFMRELISAVRVGRSLGVHLILATQKPAGVVDEQIWGNTRFRLCLRVERPEDSKEVLKRPDAALLTRPGRAYFQVGNDERFDLFQAGYGGSPYSPVGGPELKVAVPSLVALNGERLPLSATPKPRQRSVGPSQLQAVVDYLAGEATRAGTGRLASPWLPPLPEAISLDQIPHAGRDQWLEPAAGLVDDPERMYQGALRLPLGKEGHLAVYGAPGSGKTTFLLTLVTAVATAYTPAEVHLYLLDFGGRSLSLLKGLPHVGGVILPDETERVIRLQRLLFSELERRKDLFAEAGVTTLAAYRGTAAEPLPAIIVLVDNWQGFMDTYPDAEEAFVQVAREGGNLGIHVVASANAPGAIRGRISSNIKLTVALNLASPGDYAVAVGRTGGLEPAPCPGRGLIKDSPPLEFQTALPVPGETEVERSAALKRFAEEQSRSWAGPRARPIRQLPDVVPLAEVLPAGEAGSASLAAPIGLDVDSLEPFRVDLALGPHFLVAGGYQSGKSTLLTTWALALCSLCPPSRLHLHLVDFRGDSLGGLTGLPHVQSFITSDDQFAEQLTAWRESRAPDRPAVVLLIDNCELLRDGLQSRTKGDFEQLLRRERGGGFHVVAAGPTRELLSGFDGWLKVIKELGTGFLMGSPDPTDSQLFGISLPAGGGGLVSPLGRGLFIRKRQARKIKVATPEAGRLTVEDWVRQISGRKVEV